MLSKHLARIFFFYFAEKEQAAEFLQTVRGSVSQICRQISAVASRRVDVDEDSEDEFEEFAKLVRRVNVENEEPNKPVAPNARKDKADDACNDKVDDASKDKVYDQGYYREP